MSCTRETSRRACVGLKPSLTPFAKPHTLACVYHRKEPLHNSSNLSAQRVSLPCNVPRRGPLSTLRGVLLHVQGSSGLVTNPLFTLWSDFEHRMSGHLLPLPVPGWVRGSGISLRGSPKHCLATHG